MKKTMKIMAMVLFVFSLTALSSCSKSNADLILGKWQLDRVSATVGEQTEEFTAEQFAQMFGEEDMVAVLEFKSDGYVYDGYGDKSAYTIDGETLTITEEGETMTFDIVELTSTSFAFSAVEDGVLLTLYLKKV